MPLNLNNGGDFTPHIRYMASTSSWRMSGENGPEDFKLTQAVFDFENIETGWAVFEEGEAPAWNMDPSLETPAPKPGDGREWKRAFKVSVFSPKAFGDEPVREFGTNGTGAAMGIEALYSQWEQGKDANTGKVPVCKFDGATPTKVGKGNTNVPNFTIAKWIDRPDELKEGSANEPAKTEAAPAADDDSEF